MITTDLQSVTTLPVHTRKETIVGLGFDVLNGRRGSLRVDQFLNLNESDSDDVFSGRNVRAYTAHLRDVRIVIDEVFDIIKSSQEPLDIVIFPYSQALGISVRTKEND